MKKFDLRKLKIKPVTVDQIDDRMLLINLYATQAITLVIGFIWLLFQKRNPFLLFAPPEGLKYLYFGAGLAALVIAIDFLTARFVPEEANDDGGVNERIFKNRATWHIVVLSLIVSICEETLFRGAIQHGIGPYWTSIIFATIHVRYLKHWIPTGLVFAISYALGWIYIKTGTLWAPIIAHFLIDMIMGLVIRFRREA
ncbi:CPBP family intramembrane glutamic endopeptidase [Paenibacillus montanisoli]|uniref:CPBP family intramembrane metalloprotease n=1 Tax=Paenibacillus montanisoli TaxID=2081970 RepID=A0A328U0V8_9BACL|nr:CPBP family intramembrane glutamic endopeptidase [Paenibacillus montanisoli]RAP76418.1 CPBP family intramembrane metalloprotease [Paenibacillus montanisoli]